MHFSVLGVLALKFEQALCMNRVRILKTLVLEGQRLFQGSTAAGVWHHHSNTETCFTFYCVKFTAIAATISFKSMSGKKEGGLESGAGGRVWRASSAELSLGL